MGYHINYNNSLPYFQLTIEAWVRLLPNTQGLAAIGSSVTVAGTITTFGTNVQVDTQSLTVTDPALFVDKFKVSRTE